MSKTLTWIGGTPEPKLTQKQVISAIRALGLSVRVVDGEFRVNYRNGAEATAYYTNDADDALATARVGFPDAVGAV